MKRINYRFKKTDRRFRLPRIWSNQELYRVAHLFKGKVLNVSAGDDIDKQGRTYAQYFENAETYMISNFYPGLYRGFRGRDNEILLDLEEELSEEMYKQYDVVFCHTVLEHTLNVFTAFKNICYLSRDVVIIIVPFAQIQHDTDGYYDYWRFAPSLIRKLFIINGSTPKRSI